MQIWECPSSCQWSSYNVTYGKSYKIMSAAGNPGDDAVELVGAVREFDGAHDGLHMAAAGRELRDADGAERAAGDEIGEEPLFELFVVGGEDARDDAGGLRETEGGGEAA